MAVFAAIRRGDWWAASDDNDGGSSASGSDVEPDNPKVESPAESTHCSEACAGSVGDPNGISRYSIGGRLHQAGICKPCAFYYEPGCNSGAQCQFCHECPPREAQRRKRLRRQALRTQQQSYPTRRDSYSNFSHSRKGSRASWGGIASSSGSGSSSSGTESPVTSPVAGALGTASRMMTQFVEFAIGAPEPQQCVFKTSDGSIWEPSLPHEQNDASGVRTPELFRSRETSPVRYMYPPQPYMSVLPATPAMQAYQTNLSDPNAFAAFPLSDAPVATPMFFQPFPAPDPCQCNGSYGQSTPLWSHVADPDPQPMGCFDKTNVMKMGLWTSCKARGKGNDLRQANNMVAPSPPSWNTH